MITEENKLIGDHVRWAYLADPEIAMKWHVVSGSGLENCIKKSVEDFYNMDTLKFYVVRDQGDLVGYFGSEYMGRYQPTIFIHPKFRSRKKEFWAEVQKKMKPEWKGGIFTKNIPCFKFYSKMGHEVARTKTPLGEVAVFSFKKAGG